MEHQAQTCTVRLWGQTVGYLAERGGKVSFAYAADFLCSGLQLSPLRMPLGLGRFQNSSTPKVFHGLMGVFADSLPDSYGHRVAQVEQRVMTGRGGFSSIIDALTAFGTRAMGALEYVPHEGAGDAWLEFADIGELHDLAMRVLPLGCDVLPTPKNQAMLRSLSSAGGARPKAVVAYQPHTQQIRAGAQTVGALPEGWAHWLIKFDGEAGQPNEAGKVEYVYAQIAKACGIDVPPVALWYERDYAHFMAQRFDVDSAGKRWHLHSLCGLLHDNYREPWAVGYDDFLNVVMHLAADHRQVVQAFKRTVFNVLMGNQDDHTKNHALQMNSAGEWRLSPAYDLTFSPSQMGQCMTIGSRTTGIQDSDLIQLAKRHNIRNPKLILEQTRDAQGAWRALAKAQDIAPDTVRRIAEHLQI